MLAPLCLLAALPSLLFAAAPSSASAVASLEHDVLRPRSVTDKLHRQARALYESNSVVAERATVCNGHAELCDRSYGNVTFIGAHDSYAVSSTDIAANQDQNVTTQLNDGIRMLQLQVHVQASELRLCHSSCLLLDAGLLTTYLSEVNTWVVANPTEVVSILIVNIDGASASQYGSAFEASELSKRAYSPSKATTAVSDWPTLGTLIDAGTNVVVFMDNKADFTTVPYVIDEFVNMAEDAYNVLENSFNCTVSRSNGVPANQLILTNHFLDVGSGSSSIVIPDKNNIVQTNSASGTGSVGLGAQTCAALHGRYPNFILVDFYGSSNGEVFDVAANANGVSLPTNTIAKYTGGNTTSTSSAASPSTTVQSLSSAPPSTTFPWVAAMGAMAGMAVAIL